VIQVTDGERFILRLSGRQRRGPADVAAETAFLAYLDGAGVPVSAAIPTREGALFTSATLPDGPREAVLFRFVDGWRQHEIAFLLAWERDRLGTALLSRAV